MIRALHRWPGLLALMLISVLALTGAALSVFPATERLTAPQAAEGLSVATLAARIQAVYPGVEQIRRAPSGQVTAYWFEQGTPGAAIIDPATGQGIASADPNQAERWLRNLHRSLFLGDGGRISMALGAAAMLVLALSGVPLVLRRVGGWRHWFAPLRGPLSGRLHVAISRVAVFGLLLSSVTALWMSASTFGILPDGEVRMPVPAATSGLMGFDVAQMDLLRQTSVSALRDLSFPYPGDATDVLTLKTDRGIGLLDQGTGTVLAWVDPTVWQRLSEVIFMLHTGQGAAILGLVLGVMALGVPALGVSGGLIWLAGRRGRPRIRGNQPASRAETILLVGSEGGSTWGFAATLHAALTAAGQSVHVGPMSAFAPDRYTAARRILFLAATYGDGVAPASAVGFCARLAAAKPRAQVAVAVLGFGDRSFPAFGAFAQTVAQQARAKGWAELLPPQIVDRQSPQDFARWGGALGERLGIRLELSHQPVPPRTQTLTLLSRRDFGAEVQAPAAILRFALPRAPIWQQLLGRGFARFEAGDLIGILPKGSAVPRHYSLASSRRDGFVEIVVKKQPGGVCSGQLVALAEGDTVTAFLRRNPGFHAPRTGRAPLILIGAGTGIGPLAGIVRGNQRHRPIHLFFGLRHPESDFFYQDEMHAWQADGRLVRLVTAVSRAARPRHVQDALRADAARIADLVRAGARVMVCGGRDMAAGVAEALGEVLAPTGITPAALKAEGRYVEDVY